ncbi:hypothetical protein DICVIV_01207 [Dictyocaulus viviparus]|uniref:Reverse transcriptase domain-containing protein n=1 Tax=Dictyocaulus viviparus TaxID=29172 RepID=A0A0D8Y8S7_DICVI|nr:hypothetical protein DICVIV_01207 [Dictyocaulus viviparus]
MIGRRLDEEQSHEQAVFRKELSTMDYIHTTTRLIEVSREYKKSLCLTFIGFEKAFNSVETEAAIEALINQALPTPYIKILPKHYFAKLKKKYKASKKGVKAGSHLTAKHSSLLNVSCIRLNARPMICSCESLALAALEHITWCIILTIEYCASTATFKEFISEAVQMRLMDTYCFEVMFFVLVMVKFLLSYGMCRNSSPTLTH